jgi:hypothetical protein
MKLTNNQKTTHDQNNIIDIDIFGPTTSHNQGQQSTPFSFENSTPLTPPQSVQQPFGQSAPILQPPVIPPTIPPQALQQPFNAFKQQQSFVPQP